ncbi:MAG: acetyl-CoA carboxylase biotin carboxyl carrier protein [Anderseniella sp.]|nr:acetyl-CoA carboxylase biotin carboxyl carrier protein [Anderseniella sp.]
MPLSFKEVADIMKIIDSSNCEELVLEMEGVKLSVRRGGSSGAATPPALSAATPQAGATPSPGSAPPPAGKPAAATPAPAEEAGGGFTEKAPMVGTFYRRPSPEEAPFVEVGSKVKPGDPLCMIEVMKLYTTIAASTEGVVAAILVDDATLVEFDQPLFIVRPV